MSQPHILPSYKEVGRPYWMVQYVDGSFYSEFFFVEDGLDYFIAESLYRGIDRSQISWFGFLGPVRWCFHAKEGVFRVGNCFYEFSFGTDSASAVMQDQRDYGYYLKQFKTGALEIATTGKSKRRPCTGFAFGWRRSFRINDVELDIEVMCITKLRNGTSMPISSHFRITATATKPISLRIGVSMKGKTSGNYGDNLIEIIEANKPYQANLGVTKYSVSTDRDDK